MIPKICPLSDKHKLEITLNGHCGLHLLAIENDIDYCKDCSYFIGPNKIKMPNGVNETNMWYGGR